MGSGSRRNPADKVIITPKRVRVKTGGGSFSGYSKEKSLKEITCPISFKVKLSSELRLTVGMRLVVRPVKNTVAFYFGDEEVARLKVKKGQRIALCLTKGFRYEGKVKKEGRAFYVEALRTI